MAESDEEIPFVVVDPPSTFHFVIPNSTNTHILVTHRNESDPTASRYQLPFLSPPTDGKGIPAVPAVHSWSSQTGELCSVVLHFLGLHLYVRDVVWRNQNPSFDCEEDILVADLLEPANVPPKFFWASLEQVAQLTWKDIHSSVRIPELVSRVISVSCGSPQDTEKGGEKPPQPWRQAGWFADIERWFMDTMNKMSVRLHPESRLLQLRNTHHSVLLQCPLETATESDMSAIMGYKRTSEHYIFVKSSCASIPEARITMAVASHMSDLVPKILATRNDCTFVQLGAATEYRLSQASKLPALAQMQLRSLECLEPLQADGVPYHGLDWHAKHIVHMLQHPALQLLQSGDAYNDLFNRIDDLRTLFAELAAYRVPQTLIHGDFNQDNILVDPVEREVLRFVDWSSSSISHPFIDFLRLTVVDDYGEPDENAQKRYLSRWERFESKLNIARAVDLAYPLMLCENLYVQLKMYECAGLCDREDLRTSLEERLSGISHILKERHQRRFKDLGMSNAVSSLVISKDNGRHILAKQGDRNLSLPFVSAFEMNGHAATDHQLDGHGMRVMIRSQFGLDSRVVRSLWLQPEDETVRQRSAVVLETLDGDHQIPPGYQWVDANAAKFFSDGSGREQATVEAFFGEGPVEVVAPVQMPWRHFGWLGRMCEWTDDVLLRQGLKRSGGLQEVKTDVFGTVWKAAVNVMEGKGEHRMNSGVDSVFLKAGLVSQLEGNVLSVISRFAEEVVPSLLGSDPNSSAVLTTGIGSADTYSDDMDWSLFFQRFGELQIHSIGYVDLLIKAGLRCYDCEWVRCNSDRLLKECRELVGKEGSLSHEYTEIDVVRCMEELELYKLPLTLVHGDFHEGNIGDRNEAGYGIFDWGSACIGVGLCDVAVMTKVSREDLGDTESWQDAYVSVWEGRLEKRAFDRAMHLSLVYYWMLNLESLLDLIKEVAKVDRKYMKKVGADTMQHLGTAIESARLRKDKTGNSA